LRADKRPIEKDGKFNQDIIAEAKVKMLSFDGRQSWEKKCTPENLETRKPKPLSKRQS
jgi:hypothetical protein